MIRMTLWSYTTLTDSALHGHRPTPSWVAQAPPAAVAALLCMTASTTWPRIGPAAYRATMPEDELQREANPLPDAHLMASPQVGESENTLKVETRVQIPLGLRAKGLV